MLFFSVARTSRESRPSPRMPAGGGPTGVIELATAMVRLLTTKAPSRKTSVMYWPVTVFGGK